MQTGINAPGLIIMGSSAIALILGLYAWRRRGNPSGLALSLLMMATAVWSFFYGLVLFSATLSQMKVFVALSYIGNASVPVLWLLFAATYSGSGGWSRRGSLAFLGAVPLVSLAMVATDDLHRLFYSSVELVEAGGYRIFSFQPGPFWWVHVVYSNALVLMGLVLLIRMLFRVAPVQRLHVGFFIAGSMLPYAAHIVDLAGFRPYGFVNPVPLAFMGTGLVFALGVFTLKLFDIAPFARELLFRSIPDAIFVLDNRSRLIDANPAARRVLDSKGFELSKDGGIFVNSVPGDEFFSSDSGEIESAIGDRFYSVTTTGIMTNPEQRLGKLVVLHDITGRKLARENLSRLVEFQKLISNASAEFIDMAPDRADTVIEQTLAEVGAFVDADRSYMFLVSDDGSSMSNTHEWCAQGIKAHKPNLQNLSTQDFHWSLRLFRRGEALNYPDLREMPSEAGREKEEFLKEGIKSVLVVPMLMQDRLVGFLGFDAIRGRREWTEIEQDSLRLLGALMIHSLTRSRTEDALRQSESLARTVIENSPIGVSVRSPTGRLLLYNQAWVDLWDMTEERLMRDLSPRQSLAFDERDGYFSKYHEDVRRVFERGGSFLIPEMLTAGKHASSGHRRVISQHFTGITGSEGEVEKVVILTTDITQLKMAEEERASLREQLNQAQKMESVGRLAGGVAHDFNNMLGAILGHAELALDRVEPDHALASDLEEIRKAAERSAELTRQLLAFARKQTISPRVLNLNDTVEGMIKMIRRLIGENIELVWKPGAVTGRVRVDPSQIDQILTNLCVNARDAIGDTGRVIIETCDSRIDRDYCRANPDFAPGRYVMLAVSDNGSGMSLEMQSKLFEPFFTTKETGRGTGLGLSTVYGIVRQNNGFIDVRSEPGQGSTFKVFLPEYGEERKGVPAQARPGLPAEGSETVLLVEDEHAILNVTRIMLERRGYTVIPAESPETAIDLAKRCSGRIHLLVTDVVMPGMNGSDLAKAIRAIHPRIRCLFMSGYTADVIADRGVLDEGVHFIQKPFSGNALAEKARAILEDGD